MECLPAIFFMQNTDMIQYKLIMKNDIHYIFLEMSMQLFLFFV